MPPPLPFSWPVTVILVLNLCIFAYVLGTTQMRRYQDQRIESVYDINRRMAHSIRYLHQLLDLPMPDFSGEEDEEPETGRWQQARDWFRNRRSRTISTHRVVTPEAGTETDRDSEWAARWAVIRADYEAKRAAVEERSSS